MVVSETLSGNCDCADVLPFVTIVGSIPDDPSQATANSLIWQAAFDEIPVGRDGIVIIKTPGLHYLPLGSVEQSGGRRIKLVSVCGATWTDGAVTVSALVIERTTGGRQAYFDGAGSEYRNIAPVIETSEYGTNHGAYGRRQNHRHQGVVAQNPDGSFTADIADAVLAEWAGLDGAQAFGRWDVFLSPKTAGTRGWGVVGKEVNVQNRYADHGYHGTRQISNPWCVIYQLIPEAQDFPGDGSTGYNILASLFFGQSSHPGALGYPARTYNAIMGEPNAIAPGGRLIRFAGGDEANELYRDPYSAMDLTDNWVCGIDFTKAKFRGQDALGSNQAVRLGNGQSLAWKRISDDALVPIIGVNYDDTVVYAACGSRGVSICGENYGPVWVKFLPDGRIEIPNFPSWPSYPNDAAAGAGGISIGQSYRNGSALCIRVS